MQTKLGRPPKATKDRRENILRVCLTDAERRSIDRTAKADGQDTSTWARDKLLGLVKD